MAAYLGGVRIVGNLSPLDWAFLPLQRYFDFSGRSPRAEFWWFYLLTTVVSMLASLIDLVVDPETEFGMGVASMLIGLATFIPWTAVTVRRLHDRNLSGWNVIRPLLGIAVFGLLTLFGTLGTVVGGVFFFGTCLWLFVMMCLPGSPGPNPYGEHPYGLHYYPG